MSNEVEKTILSDGNWKVVERPRSCHPGVKNWVLYHSSSGYVEIASYDESHCGRGGRDRTNGHYLWYAIPAHVDHIARMRWTGALVED